MIGDFGTPHQNLKKNKYMKIEKIKDMRHWASKYRVAGHKINKIIDFLNNSQQEEKELCWSCFNQSKGKKEDVTLGIPKCDYCKNQPSKPSIREEKSLKYRISYLLWNDNNLTRIKTDEYADQILDLITKQILDEAEDDDDIDTDSFDALQGILDNIKK